MKRSLRAVSVLEVMAVTAVIGVVTAAGVPSLQSMIRTNRVNQDIVRFRNTVTDARARSQDQRQPHMLQVIDPKTLRVSKTDASCNPLAGVASEDVKFPYLDLAMTSGGLQKICITADGSLAPETGSAPPPPTDPVGSGGTTGPIGKGGTPPPSDPGGLDLTGGTGGTCFTADTLVSTRDGAKPIADIAVGDDVMGDLEGVAGAYQVIRLFRHTSDHLLLLHVGGEVIKTTDEHPFWVDGKGFVKAKTIGAGDRLRGLSGGFLIVDVIERKLGSFPVYNIEVEGAHTYFVGKHKILVHNKTTMNSADSGGSGTTSSGSDSGGSTSSGTTSGGSTTTSGDTFSGPTSSVTSAPTLVYSTKVIRLVNDGTTNPPSVTLFPAGTMSWNAGIMRDLQTEGAAVAAVKGQEMARGTTQQMK